MYSIIANGNKLAYGIKRYLVKTEEDIKTIPLGPDVAIGSRVLVSSTGERYILDTDREWVKLNHTAPGTSEDIVYEGGDL